MDGLKLPPTLPRHLLKVLGIALLGVAVVLVIPRNEASVSKSQPPERNDKPRRTPARGQKEKSPQEKLQELVRKQAAKPVAVDRPSYALEEIRKARDRGDLDEIGKLIPNTRKGEFREVWSIIGSLPGNGHQIRSLQSASLGYGTMVEGIEIVLLEILASISAGEARNQAMVIAFAASDSLEESRRMQEMLVESTEHEAAEEGIVFSYQPIRLTESAVKNPLLLDFRPSNE